MLGEGELTFAAVDAMSLGAAASGAVMDVREVGAYVEFSLLLDQGRIAPEHSRSVVVRSGFSGSFASRDRNRLIEIGRSAGFLRFDRVPVPDVELTRLSNATLRAASTVGFSDRVAGQLSAALGELAGNVMDHAEKHETGFLAYQGLNGHFEFVVADQGVGALASLRGNPTFVGVTEDRIALQLVLQPGTSRFSEVGRGHGFDRVFEGLANHNGSLRFRSGDAAVLIDSSGASAFQPKVKRRADLQGFLISVRCRP